MMKTQYLMKNRVLVTLTDRNGKIIKKKTINKSLRQVADSLGIKESTEISDTITIESEEEN